MRTATLPTDLHPGDRFALPGTNRIVSVVETVDRRESIEVTYMSRTPYPCLTYLNPQAHIWVETEGEPTMAKIKSKPAAAAKPSTNGRSPKLTKAQLEQAARLREGGTSWGDIREKFGTKLNSSGFRKAWDKEGITGPAARERTAPAAKPAAAKKAVTRKATKAKADPSPQV